MPTHVATPAPTSRSGDDPTLIGHTGLLLTGELVRRPEVVETIEEAVNRVGPFKQRRRGLNAGELMVSLTVCRPEALDNVSSPPAWM